MALGERRLFFRIVRAVLATASLLLGIETYYLWHQYIDTRPSFMDVPSGHVHALYAQGWTVYLTSADQFRLYGMAGTTAACLAGAVALDLFVLDKKEAN